MGFDQELEADRKKPTSTSDVTPTPGRATAVDPTSATTDGATPEAKTDPEARIKELIAQLEKQFGRRPELAKQTATTLSIEFPNLYSTEWLLGVIKQIDLAQWKKAQIDAATRHWDDKPGAARYALQQLKKKFPRDAKLVKWCNGFLAKIEVFQLTLQAKNWDRPGDAKKALVQLRDRGVISKREFAARDEKMWAYQDAKWAERVTTNELRTWLGANVIEWDEAPDEVKRELQIRLGQLKRDQLLGPGGGGVRSTRALAAPTNEETRRIVLDRAGDASPTFEFATTEELPVRRLDLTAVAIDREAARTEALVPQPKPTEGGLLQQRPDVMTELLNKTFTSRAEDLRKTSGAYRALAQRIRTKQTTIAAERALLTRDRGALDLAIFEQASILKRLETSGDTEQAGNVRKSIEALRQNRQQIDTVLADPDGVAPGAGRIINELKFPEPVMSSVSPASRETADVGRITRGIDRVTGTETGYERGIGRNFSEIMTGLVKLSGRVQAFQAGVFRLVVDGASYVLPDSLTNPLRNFSEDLSRSALALKNAESAVTAANKTGRDMYTAAGGTIPLIDRVLSPEKIFENPDVALFTVLTALPNTKGIGLLATVGVAGLQTAEAFFSTYGLTGKLDEATRAAGWSAVQNTAGIVLGRLGLGAAGDTVANVALVFAFGKLRGLSRTQIEDEIAYALIGAAIGAGVGRVRAKPITNVTRQANEVVTALEQGGKVTGATLDAPASKPRDAKHAERIDITAAELQQAMITAREITQRLQIAQQQKKPTAPIIKELEAASTATKAKKTELTKLFAEDRATTPGVEPTVQPKPVETTPVEAIADVADATAVETDVTAARETKFNDLWAENKPTDSLSPNLHYNALAKRAAEARAKHPELAGLTDAEIIALIGYTTADAMDVNSGLRGQLGEGANAEAATYADMVSSAMAKLPDQTGTFTRLVNYDAAMLAKFEKGAVVTEPGFSSTSRLTSAELGELSITGNTELTIHGRRGKKLDFLSKKPNEAEVLFKAGTKFRVDSVEKVGATTKITLTEVD